MGPGLPRTEGPRRACRRGAGRGRFPGRLRDDCTIQVRLAGETRTRTAGLRVRHWVAVSHGRRAPCHSLSSDSLSSGSGRRRDRDARDARCASAVRESVSTRALGVPRAPARRDGAAPPLQNDDGDLSNVLSGSSLWIREGGGGGAAGGGRGRMTFQERKERMIGSVAPRRRSRAAARCGPGCLRVRPESGCSGSDALHRSSPEIIRVGRESLRASYGPRDEEPRHRPSTGAAAGGVSELPES
jgi:hypothetical protein